MLLDFEAGTARAREAMETHKTTCFAKDEPRKPRAEVMATGRKVIKTNKALLDRIESEIEDAKKKVDEE